MSIELQPNMSYMYSCMWPFKGRLKNGHKRQVVV